MRVEIVIGSTWSGVCRQVRPTSSRRPLRGCQTATACVQSAVLQRPVSKQAVLGATRESAVGVGVGVVPDERWQRRAWRVVSGQEAEVVSVPWTGGRGAFHAGLGAR